ncbi:MAG TPA: hypothetical protein VM094_02865 [Gemmatimonadales bacterium]|nr:hypothetical protein [Gemmatimonadales bacterium]
MRRRTSPIAILATALAATLVAAGCASSTTSGGSTEAPAPEPIDPNAPPAPEGGHGSAVSYSPVQGAAYRLEHRDSLVLQYPGGASQTQARDRVAFLHLTLAEGPEKGTYSVAIRLDSLQALESGTPAPADSVAAARGTVWSGTLSSVGTLSPLKADRSGTLTDELAGHLRLLFPALPQGGVREGMQWTDSTQYPLVSDAFTGTESSVTVYRATDQEETEGRETIPLETNSKYNRAGKRVQAEQELEMTASGTRTGVHRLGVDGVLVSAQGTDTGEMMISVPALGQTVPIKRSSTYAVTSLAPGR